MEFTYAQIEPLIVYAEEQGSKMICEFKAPGTDSIVNSEASIQRLRTMQSQVSRVAKRTVTNQLRRVASRTLRSVLGSGILGRTSSQVFNTASRTTGVGMGYTSEEKKTAVVAAFKRVAANFNFDQSSGSWSLNTGGSTAAPAREGRSKISVSPKRKEKVLLSEFEEFLAKNPVKNTYDKEILSRMLAELAQADGNISEEERAFLDSFTNKEIGDAETLLAMGELSPIECEEVSEKSKASIYMLAWTITMVDFELDPAELTLLEEYVKMLGLKERDKDASIKRAKYYVLEQVMGSELSKAELFEYASQIELSEDDAERCRIQWKKRQ